VTKQKTLANEPLAAGHKPVSAKVPLRVALVEDNPKFRENLYRLINSFSDLSCPYICKSGEEALRVIPETPVDVVLMDIFLPRMSGIECTSLLKELMPKTPIIIFTAMEDEDLIFLALKAGADGYLLKRTKPADVRIALLEAFNGGAPMSSEIARRVIDSFKQKTKIQTDQVKLSLRQEQILILLSKGYSNKQIANQLDLSIDTICHHLKHVFELLHVRSRTEAVVRYIATKAAAPKLENSTSQK